VSCTRLPLLARHQIPVLAKMFSSFCSRKHSSDHKHWCSILSGIHDLPSSGRTIPEGPTLIPIVGIFRDTERGGESVSTIYTFSTYNYIQDIVAFKISYVEKNNHRYTVCKDLRGNPNGRKNTKRLLIYRKITSTGSTNFQDSPAPTRRRHQPPEFSSTNPLVSTN
jgi:hypothetical protein